MKWIYDDGGRAAAGYKGSAGDCVTRAVAIATGLPYPQVYEALAQVNADCRQRRRAASKRGVRSARNGVAVSCVAFKRYMTSIGWVWTPTMHIGSGCKVHLRADELPAGRLIVSVSRHYTAVIDGVIHDTHNPSDRGTTIYSANTPPDKMPKGVYWLANGNGWAYAPDRCVYGYWQKKGGQP